MNISNFDTLLTSDILAAAIVYSCSAASVIRSSRPLHPLSFSSCFEFQLIWSSSSQNWREVKSLILNEMLSTSTIPSGMSNERNSSMISRFGIVRRFGDIPYHFHSFPEYSLIFFLYRLYIKQLRFHFWSTWQAVLLSSQPMLMSVMACADLSDCCWFCDPFASSIIGLKL